MYKVKDLVYDNRQVTMSDGSVIKFANQIADVPDQFVEYFKRISDFQVQTHTEDAPVTAAPVEPVVEATPAEEAAVESDEPEKEEEAEVEAEKVEPAVEDEEPETFKKVTSKTDK